MKVLSIKEPFATLIKEETKRIETRSWKTNYRGEIYIHASKSKIAKEKLENKKLMSLVKDKDYKYGNIVCKCILKDCIYMTKEFIEELKKNNPNEYTCGHYEVGRYAWVLENIEIIKPIPAKGKLGIWNYEKELIFSFFML